MRKLFCKIGIHEWGYRSTDTGIYLHAFANGKLARDKSYYDKKKCWNCEKIGSLPS